MLRRGGRGRCRWSQGEPAATATTPTYCYCNRYCLQPLCYILGGCSGSWSEAAQLALDRWRPQCEGEEREASLQRECNLPTLTHSTSLILHPFYSFPSGPCQQLAKVLERCNLSLRHPPSLPPSHHDIQQALDPSSSSAEDREGSVVHSGGIDPDRLSEATDDQLRSLLRVVFGHPDFRGRQLEVIRPVLNGSSLLAILPTGAGQ